MEFSKHIRDRYAERMAGRDTVLDINTYVAQNGEKIEKDITKLLEHSSIIYEGVCPGYKEPVRIRQSGSWLIVVSLNEQVGITLYKIEFGIGEEFNKAYISKWIERLNADLAELEERKAKCKEEVDAYKKAIESNVALVAEYEGYIKKLKNDTEYYKEIIKNKDAEYSDVVMRVNADINALTKRKEF